MVFSEWVLNFDLFCLSKIFEEGVFSRVSRWYINLLCFIFGDIMLFGIVYSYKYNSLITHVKPVTPSNNVVFLHYYTECTGTYFERIYFGIYYTRRVPVD